MESFSASVKKKQLQQELFEHFIADKDGNLSLQGALAVKTAKRHLAAFFASLVM